MPVSACPELVRAEPIRPKTLCSSSTGAASAGAAGIRRLPRCDLGGHGGVVIGAAEALEDGGRAAPGLILIRSPAAKASA